MPRNMFPFFGRRSFLASSAGASPIALHPFSTRAAAGQAHLRIVVTMDLHVHVWPYDYYADRERDTLGPLHCRPYRRHPQRGDQLFVPRQR